MAQPDIVKGTYIDIMVGDGDDPEVFVAICGLTTKSFTDQVNTNDSFVPDCADPEDIPVRRLVPTGRQWDLAGEGLANLAQMELIRSLMGTTANYRFRVARPAGSDVGRGYYEGPAMLTNRQENGSTGNGEFMQITLAIASDGEWEWTDVDSTP